MSKRENTNAARGYDSSGLSKWTRDRASPGNGYTESLARRDGMRRGGPPTALALQLQGEIDELRRKLKFVNSGRRVHLESKIAAKSKTLARLRSAS
jgi:hypothetical protein